MELTQGHKWVTNGLSILCLFVFDTTFIPTLYLVASGKRCAGAFEKVEKEPHSCSSSSSSMKDRFEMLYEKHSNFTDLK